jgi:hypothetical protein
MDHERAKLPVVPYVITLGNMLTIVAILASAGAGIYESGKIVTALQDGVANERETRQADTQRLAERITSVGNDVHELRLYVMNSPAYVDKRERIKP